MDKATELARKLQLKPGSGLWIWPEDASAIELLTEAPDIERADVDNADVAVLFAADRQTVDTVMTEYAKTLASTRAVWIVYAKGNKTDINRDSLWVQLADYRWKAVSQVSYDQTLSALRVRPLKDGEPSPV